MSKIQDYADKPDLNKALQKLNFVPLRLDENFKNGANTLIKEGFVQVELFTRPNETGEAIGWALFVKEDIAGHFVKSVVEEAIDELREEMMSELQTIKRLLKSSIKSNRKTSIKGKKGVKF